MTRRDHCYGTEGSIPMSCGSEPRGRALEALVDPARAKGAVRRIGEELGVPPRGSTHLGQEGPDRSGRPARHHH